VLSHAQVDENSPTGTTVGTLSATDADLGDSHVFSLVAGAGSSDNASFTVDGTALKTAAVFDFEAKASYSIRVRATDSGLNVFEKQLTVTINDLNEAPTNIALSASAIDENVAGGSTVGTLSATDPDPANTH